jgi:tetratricopeptide (TPR) repeat protein
MSISDWVDEGLADLERLVQAQPAQAYRRALEGLTADPSQSATLRYLAGLAAVELGDLDGALDLFREALSSAPTAREPALPVRLHLSLAVLLAQRGNFDEGLDHAREAERRAPPTLAAAVIAQLGLLHQRRGDWDEALAAYGRAIVLLEAQGDYDRAGRARNNRALVRAGRGELALALAELEQVERHWASTANPVWMAKARHNRALVIAQAGQLARALELMAEASALLPEAAALDRSVILGDRCKVLVEAGLAEDAWPVADAAIAALRAVGAELELAELHLLVGRLALLSGRTDRARRYLAEASARLEELGLRRAAAQASTLLAVGRLLDEELGDGPFPQPDDIPVAVHAALALFEAGSVQAAADLVATVVRARRRGPELERVQLAIATGIAAFAVGDWRRVRGALRAGYGHLERQLVSLASPQLRAATLRQAVGLATVGAALAMRRESVTDAFLWAERSRQLAASLRVSRRPSAGLEQLIGQLRAVENERSSAAGEAEQRDVERQQVNLERRIRDLAWQEELVGAPQIVPGIDLERLRARLGHRTLLAYVAGGGSTSMLVVRADAPVRLVAVGPTRELGRAVATVRAALTELGTGPANPAHGRRLRERAERLDQALGRPGEWAGDGPLVVVPTGALAGVAWALLPSVVGRPVAVSPSAGSWRPMGAPTTDSVLLVAGPGLEQSAAEVTELARGYPAATCLIGASATTAEVTRALSGVEVAHVSAHGRFRRDNPLLSGLALADGQLYVQDLERLTCLPRLFVWSACELGRGSISSDDQLLGLCSALSGRGCEALVAANEVVGDGETRQLMTDYHQRLRAGEAPDVALAGAQQAASRRGHWTVASFCAFSVP